MSPRNPTCQSRHSKLETRSPKVAVLFANFGPYHLARVGALSTKCRLTAIEFAREQEIYGWKINRRGTGILTLDGGTLENTGRPLRLLRAFARLIRALERSNPEHIMLPGYHDPRSLIAALWARIRGASTILMFESTEQDHPRGFAKETVKRLIVRNLFDYGFAGGSLSASYLRKLGIPGESIVTKYDVVDNDFFQFGTELLRERVNLAGSLQSEKHFLFVGRLADEKNLFTLLDAFDAYRKAGGTWSLVIVGKGPLEKSVRQKITLLGLTQSAELVGFKSHQELLPVYASASCLVLPSSREPWGLVANEAMAAALPVIISKACGCAPELVREGVNGFTFDPLKPKDLSQLMMVVSSATPAELLRMGRSSRSIIERFSPEAWANAAISLIEDKENRAMGTTSSKTSIVERPRNLA